LIPPALLVARYFAEEQAAIEQRQAEQDSLSQELEALVEEHGGDDGLLSEATNDKGSLTKGGLKQRLKEIAGDPELAEEQAVLEQCQTVDGRRSGSQEGRKGGPGSAGHARCLPATPS
jgi:type I restriction enzyme M protein